MTNNVDLIKYGIRLEKKTSHSGLELDWWWDLEKLLAGPEIIRLKLGNALSRLYPTNLSISIAGIERGGWAIAQLANRRRGQPGPTAHELCIGKDGIITPFNVGSWKCILIDDVVTTGQSMLDAEKALEKHGITVVQRVCVLDRREEIRDLLHRESDTPPGFSLEITSLFTTADLVAAGLVPGRE